MTVQEIKQAMQGEWNSIAPEIRPSSIKSPEGSIKPFYLTRTFKYQTTDEFHLTILNLADPYARTAIAKLFIRGHIVWQGDHPIVAGAQKVIFIADLEYTVTPLLQPFADVLNGLASKALISGKSIVSRVSSKKHFLRLGSRKDRCSRNTI